MEALNRMNILLVEDNTDHAELALKALENGHAASRVHWVRDGEEALDFLYRRGRFTNPGDAPRPVLILLDLKLPKVDGQEVLQRIKSDESLRSIPVVMLTAGDRAEEIAATYRAGANSFVIKPPKFTDFVERIKTIKGYWVVTNRLPEG
jgi:CheY-like chemotaxis protein